MNVLPLLWAQAAPVPPGSPALLALRRWCGGLTLSSPSLLPRPFGVWVWIGGLGALLLVAMVIQGPWRALSQFFDLPGHARLLGSALSRLRRAGRLVAITCGLIVLVWTANQAVAYLQSTTSVAAAAANTGTVIAPPGTRDLRVVLFSKGVGEVAVEEGILAGLTCLRDLLGLGDYLLLVTVAAALVFRLSADRWSGVSGPAATLDSSGSSWTTLYWGGAWLYALYRLAAMFDPGELPLGGCLFLEAALIPVLMAIADGLLLAWVLVELRNASLSLGGEPLDVTGAIGLVPGSILACLLGLPARYLATGILLALPYVPGFANGAPEAVYAKVAWGLIAAQGVALLFVGLAGAVAWNGGSWWAALRGYVRLLAKEGGHLTAALALGGALAAAASAFAYGLVLTLPAQPWVLYAADSYAHYATLVIGLLTLSALVELGERSLPLARRAVNEEALVVNV